MILTIEYLAQELCRAVVENEDEDTIRGKAAFLKAIFDQDWASMPEFDPVVIAGNVIGVVETGEVCDDTGL